jgi:hypothetical protein
MKWFNFTISALLLSFLFISFSTKENAPKPDTSAERNLPQIIRSVLIENNVHFAGEEVSMENSDLRERLERELIVNSYRHSSTIQYLKLMNRHFPKIESILKEEGIPDDFKYLAVAESGLINAVSPANAKGYWQFLKGTAQDFGLGITDEVDERYHMEKSTRAACAYLNMLFKKFGNWSLAAAAYNMGENALNRELERQKEDSYYDMNLNRETMRYLFRILAIKEIHLHPEKYGFFMDQSDLYQPLNNVYQILIEEPQPSLADLAHKYGITYRQLKRYNPWLINHKLTRVEGKSYYVEIPKSVKD